MMAIFRYLPFREAVKKIEPFLLKIFGTFTVKITFCVPNLSFLGGGKEGSQVWDNCPK